METFVADRLFGNFDRRALESPLARNQKRTVSSYSTTDLWGTFSPRGPSGERPSAYCNPFAKDILRLRNRLRRQRALSQESAMLYTTDNMWDTIIDRGTDVGETLHGNSREEPAGLECLRRTFHCIEELVRCEGTKLEPFQLEVVRACICSRAVRLLGEDLGKYVGTVLQIVGLSDVGTDETYWSETALLEKFRRYCRRFVAVVAPRRNGKSKAGKLFVAANAVCEPAARIVLLAHQLNAVMLYKSDVLRHLHQILDLGLASFKIHAASNEIRIEFHDRPSSHVYFVAGGINVSIRSLQYDPYPLHHYRAGTSFNLEFHPICPGGLFATVP